MNFYHIPTMFLIHAPTLQVCRVQQNNPQLLTHIDLLYICSRTQKNMLNPTHELVKSFSVTLNCWATPEYSTLLNKHTAAKIIFFFSAHIGELHISHECLRYPSVLLITAHKGISSHFLKVSRTLLILFSS